MNAHTIRRAALAGAALFVAAVAMTLVFSPPAGAAVLQEAADSAPVGNVLTVSAAGVNLLVGLVLPVLAGIALKETNPAWVKVIFGILLAGVAALVTEAIRDDGTAVISWDMFLTAAQLWAVQIAAYLGIYRPLGQDTARGSFNASLGSGFVPFERGPAASSNTTSG